MQAAEIGAEGADEANELFSERPLAAAVAGGRKVEESSMQRLLDQYFGKDEELSGDELFLKKFIRQQVSLYPVPLKSQ